MMNHLATTCIMKQRRQTDPELTVSGKEQFNKPLHRAVLSFACAVRRMVDLTEIPCPDGSTQYHIAEYLAEMEALLVDQLLTALPTPEERDAVLSVAGLDYLSERVAAQEKDWEGA